MPGLCPFHLGPGAVGTRQQPVLAGHPVRLNTGTPGNLALPPQPFFFRVDPCPHSADNRQQLGAGLLFPLIQGQAACLQIVVGLRTVTILLMQRLHALDYVRSREGRPRQLVQPFA